VRAAVVEGEEREARSFVLATGRYIGGGLVKRRLVREPLLDLGVFYRGDAVRSAYGKGLRYLEYLESAPAFETGLMTDASLRPLDWHGEVAFQNLRAAGAVLGGYDYAGGFGFGVPLLTGAVAGRAAAA
jgi:glycerol-3-phosphate dehydrogenase subunit B